MEEEDFQSADIFILSPEDAARSDEDSGPEDDDGIIDNLTGNQLRAVAEATITVSGFNRERLGLAGDAENDAADTAVEIYPGQDGGAGDVLAQAEMGSTTRPSKRAKQSIPPVNKPGEPQLRTSPPVRQWVKRDLDELSLP